MLYATAVDTSAAAGDRRARPAAGPLPARRVFYRLRRELWHRVAAVPAGRKGSCR